MKNEGRAMLAAFLFGGLLTLAGFFGYRVGSASVPEPEPIRVSVPTPIPVGVPIPVPFVPGEIVWCERYELPPEVGCFFVVEIEGGDSG